MPRVGPSRSGEAWAAGGGTTRAGRLGNQEQAWLSPLLPLPQTCPFTEGIGPAGCLWFGSYWSPPTAVLAGPGEWGGGWG